MDRRRNIRPCCHAGYSQPVGCVLEAAATLLNERPAGAPARGAITVCAAWAVLEWPAVGRRRVTALALCAPRREVLVRRFAGL